MTEPLGVSSQYVNIYKHIYEELTQTCTEVDSDGNRQNKAHTGLQANNK